MIGVVGAGAMGAGIAQVALAHGHPVVLADAHAPTLTKAQETIERALSREMERGRLTADAMALAIERLRIADADTGFDDLATCSLVFEAIVERLEAKREVFRALESVVGRDCILATNTSSLSIASIGAACDAPHRVIGIHFFNPAPVMPLVEIVPGVRTTEGVTDDARALIDGWGKVTVRAADTPGFIVNRIARPYYGEALRVLEEGEADVATIDWAMRERGGFRMGPFELMDFIGHDVNYLVTESVWTAMYYDPRYRPSLTQKRLLEAGLLGRKAGRGFYDYGEGATRPDPVQDAALADRLVRRIVALLVNEAADAVNLRIASARDVEVAMTRGVNYPRGLLAWGNAIGVGAILEELERLQSDSGDDRYRPSALLRRCVRDGLPLPT
ncbi:MAG: 3-hydroxybutyryl-CoA dehydrogenase [Gemmatimonadaceae bacterium]|nr:3-hydroxybutyryl-CoA dehydrogenase [Gemmatimonadaceae bacterium]